MHILEFQVRPSEIDSFGHVNNAVYLEYLEWARSDWGDKHEVPYARMIELKVLPAVVEAKLRFQGEARLGDTLRIETQAELVHSAMAKFHHEIRNLSRDNRRVLRADVKVVAMDLETRSFTEFPDLLRRHLVPE